MPPLESRSRARQASPSGPVDARYASPQRTWRTFAAAMRAGDRATARACFTPSALEDYGAAVDSLSPDELRAMVDRLGGSEPRLEPSTELDPFRLMRTTVAAQRPKWILLERVNGEWKIAAI